MNKKDPNPIDAFVGSRVRMRRLMIGLSQEKLADGLGITFQQVQKYEKGTNRIGASRLQAIADILGVHPSFSSSRTKAVSTRASPLPMFTSPRRFHPSSPRRRVSL